MITFFSIIVVSLIIFYYEYTLIVGVLLGLLIYKIIHEIYKFFHRENSKILFSGGLFQNIMSKKDLESLRDFILSKNPDIIEYQVFIISPHLSGQQLGPSFSDCVYLTNSVKATAAVMTAVWQLVPGPMSQNIDPTDLGVVEDPGWWWFDGSS